MPSPLNRIPHVLLFLSLAFTGANAQIVDYTNIAVHGDETPRYEFCSADGSVVFSQRTGGGKFFRWSATGGVQEVPPPVNVAADTVSDTPLSDDGNRVWEIGRAHV